jgi:hypothetical protein
MYVVWAPVTKVYNDLMHVEGRMSRNLVFTVEELATDYLFF